MYPEGRGQAVAKAVTFNGAPFQFVTQMANILRTRVTIANVNLGIDLLPAIQGIRWQLLDAKMISVGGAAGAATTVDITATQSAASVKLLASAIAALTQSAVLRAGAANAVVLADGASFALCDNNAAIRASKTGASLTTATHIDYFLEYLAVLAS
jgi:hypothetical protein